MENYFEYIPESIFDGTLSEKENIIKHVLKKYKLNKQETIMYDIIWQTKMEQALLEFYMDMEVKKKLEEEEQDIFAIKRITHCA
jgi:hypothetical protein